MSSIFSTTKNRGFKHDKEICWKHEPIDFENTTCKNLCSKTEVVTPSHTAQKKKKMVRRETDTLIESLGVAPET